MSQELIILVAEDDVGHAGLICRNLKRAGIINPILHFHDGEKIMDFLFQEGEGPHRQPGLSYVLLLDINMPGYDGIAVLERVKSSTDTCKLPVIMITTTDDPREVDRCHALGCNSYITKPVLYENFVYAIRQLGLYLSVVQVPIINGGC